VPLPAFTIPPLYRLVAKFDVERFRVCGEGSIAPGATFAQPGGGVRAARSDAAFTQPSYLDASELDPLIERYYRNSNPLRQAIPP